MTTTFVSAPKFLLTSESVTEGHPDKICDQISDAILDEIIAQDPDARVACDCMVTTGLVFVTGEMKHHDRLASRDAHLVTILAGHYATEQLAVGGLARLLRAALPEIKILTSTSERNPTTWR